MKLKELRQSLGLTQPEVATILSIPLRTYCRYEDDSHYEGSFKYNQFISLLNNHAKDIVLTVDIIEKAVNDVLKNYKVSACYLFGSYAKNKARPESDIDLMIVSEIEGLQYFEIISLLEEKLRKIIDLIRLDVAIQNTKLINEILKDGIKIYG